MKKVSVFLMLSAFAVVFSANSAPLSSAPVSGTQRRGQTAQASDTTPSPVVATSARSAVRTPVRGVSVGSATAPARAATASRVNTATTSSSSVRSAISPTTVARAGAMQKVVNTGTKIASATQNVVVSDACRQKYDGCMDSFCMLDNTSGGRCLCSDQYSDLQTAQIEIDKLDARSYKMATEGVEELEMGSDASETIANANAIIKKIIDGETNTAGATGRRLPDLSLWSKVEFDADIDIFSIEQENPFAGKSGDAMHRAAAEICVAQMPECGRELSMLQMMYAQQIKSNCTAYENDLRVQKNKSTEKLAAAENALQGAALDALRAANKLDLGQCTTEFKKCMSTTAGCGEDFTGCVGIAAAENAKMYGSAKANMKMFAIKGSVTEIKIAASTMDALESKKEICMHVTNSCSRSKDQVWDTFLREVAPQLKTAELLAESDLRSNCISNISACFLKACQDTIDPKNPDGSYDICLSRPETMRSLCRVQIDPCVAAEPTIMDSVYLRVGALRVDECTLQVKSCFTNENSCGENYQNCIGMDLADIKKMCPLEKLTACQKGGKLTSIDELDGIVRGLFAGIDDTMLNQCQKIVTNKMVEVCGDLVDCDAFADDEFIGTESLTSYKDNDGNYVLDGLVSFGNVKIEKAISSDKDVKFSLYEININDYKNHLSSVDPTTARVVGSLQSTANKINQKIAIITQDPKIQMCINGRDMSQIEQGRTNPRSGARYPSLLDPSMLTLINAGMDKANANYMKKYNKLSSEAVENQSDDTKAALCAAMASGDNAKYTCVTYEGEVCIEYQYDNPFDNLFNTSAPVGLSGNAYSLRYTISGATISNSLKIASLGKSEYAQTDEKGNMVGRVTMASIYSASTNTCMLTTTTTMCEDMKEIITTSTSTSSGCNSGGISLFGGGCKRGGLFRIGGGKKTDSSTVTEEFQGVACTKFAEPIVTTNTVRM